MYLARVRLKLLVLPKKKKKEGKIEHSNQEWMLMWPCELARMKHNI